ncbi:MAG: cyclase family protein [Armatimonadota bacterium]
MQIHDISRVLRNGMPVWPGDTPYEYERTWQMGPETPVNVGAIRCTVHAGAHVDAPLHFLADGASAAELPLEPFLGPAVVADLRGREIIRIADLEPLDFSAAPRLLLRTDAWPAGASFPETIPVVAEDVPAFLAGRGVRLLGVDVPSVDAIDSKTLPNHRALAAGGICILESLDLSRVEPGVYELIALPLRLEGADGSPVRAVLRAQG